MLIKWCCIVKHTTRNIHITNFSAIQRLSIGSCTAEHTYRCSDITNIPIIYWLIKWYCITKLTIHCSHITNIPIYQRLIKSSNVRDIVTTLLVFHFGNITIEDSLVNKCSHVLHCLDLIYWHNKQFRWTSLLHVNSPEIGEDCRCVG